MNEVEELCNRVAIIRAGRIVYEGRLDELRATRGRQLHAAHVRRRAGRADLREPPGHRATSSSRPDGLRVRGRRGRDRGAQPRARRARASRCARWCPTRPRSRSASSRSPRIASSAPRRRAPSSSGWPDAAHARPSTAGSCASSSRRSAPTSASPRRSSRRRSSSSRSRLQSGSPNDVPFGRYVRDSGLAAPLVLLTFGSIWLFPLIASLVAGDIVAAEDGNGTLKTILTRSVDARPAVRGQGRSGRDLRAARARRDGRRLAHRGHDRLGLQPDHEPLGHDRLGLARARCSWSPASASTRCRCSRSPRSACCSRPSPATPRAPSSARSMMALLMQLIGILPGRRRDQAVPADDAVRRLARLPAHADRLGSRSRAAAGCRRSTRPSRWRPRTSSFLRRDVAGG